MCEIILICNLSYRHDIVAQNILPSNVDILPLLYHTNQVNDIKYNIINLCIRTADNISEMNTWIA